jgi:phage antirepressor YoqD-like protein
LGYNISYEEEKYLNLKVVNVVTSLSILNHHKSLGLQEHDFIRHLLDHHYLTVVHHGQWEELMGKDYQQKCVS